jgi:hypothetical protein
LGHYSNPAPAPTRKRLFGRNGATPPPAATHRTQRQLRSVEVDALVEDYQAGATITQLVERFRISRTTVMAHLDRRGVQRRAVEKQWDQKRLASAARRYADGSSLATIAAQFGLDPSTVANRFRRAGVPIRPRRARVGMPQIARPISTRLSYHRSPAPGRSRSWRSGFDNTAAGVFGANFADEPSVRVRGLTGLR